MILSLFSLALFTLYVGLAVFGIVLAVRQRRGWRFVGIGLLLQAVLFTALQVALSTLPITGLEPMINVPLQATLVQAAATILAVGGVGLLVWLLARRVYRRLQEPRQWPAKTALLVGLPLVALVGMGGLWQLSLPDRVRERDPDKRTITVPEGFAASVFVKGQIDNPTSLAFGPDNKLYIGDIGGSIWVADDSRSSGQADKLTRFAEGFRFLVGLIWHNGELYTASEGKVEALRDSDGDGQADARRTIVDGLPAMKFVPHTNNALTFGPDGRLYFGVGSTTDGQIETEQYAAAILSVNPDGSDLRVFARGTSNSFDVAFNKAGDLFAGDNQPSASVSGTAGDELNYIVEDGHYGYPYFFGDPPKEGNMRGPVASFPPHSSPNGLTFYNATQFPTSYTDNLFIALWSLGEISRVELAKSAGGEYLSRTSTFASGFVYPLDVTVGPDGSLFVADFGTSAVYRIRYTGNQ